MFDEIKGEAKVCKARTAQQKSVVICVSHRLPKLCNFLQDIWPNLGIFGK